MMAALSHAGVIVMPTRPSMMTARQAARYLHISRATLYRLVAVGELPAMKIGKIWRLDASVLDAWMAAKTVKPRRTQ